MSIDAALDALVARVRALDATLTVEQRTTASARAGDVALVYVSGYSPTLANEMYTVHVDFAPGQMRTRSNDEALRRMFDLAVELVKSLKSDRNLAGWLVYWTEPPAAELHDEGAGVIVTLVDRYGG